MIDDVIRGYTFDGPTVDLGALVVDGEGRPDAQIRLPLRMLNRHGLVAGATGTGKTKTLQLMAEQLSAHGVPVFLADIKGDLSGLASPGVPSDSLLDRASGLGQDWRPSACPVEFYALGGVGEGIPLRATMTAFGPTLLSKVLGLNDTQESSLGLVFHFADQRGLPLLDLKDLRSVIQYLLDNPDALKGVGGLSKQTAGVILRALTNFAAEGAERFFGEPEFDTADLMRVTPDGRGVVSILDAKALKATVSTFPDSGYDLEEALTRLGIGEAIVTVLSEQGVPTPVAWTRLRAPRSLMAPSAPDVVTGVIEGSPLDRKYRQESTASPPTNSWPPG